jgi:2-oxoisovalerate dehydrogenase E2 component (dihydrolipoyl transacylase)
MTEIPEALEPIVPHIDVSAEERRTTGERRQEELPVEEDRREGEWRAAPPKAEPAPAEAKKSVQASPAVRQRARDLGIDLARVEYAGDRVRHADLDAFLLYHGGGVAHGAGPRRQDETVKVVGLRRKIAENMQEAKRRIPHFTLVEEYDVTALEQTRAMMNQDRGSNPKLTMLPFLITAFARQFADYPQLNATYDDEAQVITRHGPVHMGMATQTPNGLMVAVIRDAQNRDLWNLATEVSRLAEAARTGKATREELAGSTITITSLGALGGLVTTPVINHPEVAIIGVNRMVERPVFRGGIVVARQLMNLSSSFDHRVIDGMVAAEFIQTIRGYLECPATLFVE